MLLQEEKNIPNKIVLILKKLVSREITVNI